MATRIKCYDEDCKYNSDVTCQRPEVTICDTVCEDFEDVHDDED